MIRGVLLDTPNGVIERASRVTRVAFSCYRTRQSVLPDAPFVLLKSPKEPEKREHMRKIRL